MKICHGDDRMVILLGPVALKFINPKIFKFSKNLKRVQLAWALLANITEWLTWRSCHSPYLARTYFSLGFLTIAGREMGEFPSQDELNQIRESFSRELTEAFREASIHALRSPKNWMKTERGLVLLDYSDDCYGRNAPPLSMVLLNPKYQKELEGVLIKPYRGESSHG